VRSQAFSGSRRRAALQSGREEYKQTIAGFVAAFPADAPLQILTPLISK